MLININPLLSPDLLKILREMGHGDQIAIVDANYPAASGSRKLVRLEGCNATDALDAILSVMPIDAYVDTAVNTMQVVDAPDTVPPIVQEFKSIVALHDKKASFSSIERYRFYDEVKDAYAVVATSEMRLYGNIILRKGVISPTG